MITAIILGVWLYYVSGAFLLIFRGQEIMRPKDRIWAWLLWPFRKWPRI
jgi:hypothetical protein